MARFMMQWVENINLGRFPKWALRSGLGEDGRVFVSAALAGREWVILWDVMQEGAMYFLCKDNHVYLPTDYMKKRYPKTLKACEVQESQTRIIVFKSKELVPECVQDLLLKIESVEG
jgi:hypothetical protein